MDIEFKREDSPEEQLKSEKLYCTLGALWS